MARLRLKGPPAGGFLPGFGCDQRVPRPGLGAPSESARLSSRGVGRGCGGAQPRRRRQGLAQLGAAALARGRARHDEAPGGVFR